MNCASDFDAWRIAVVVAVLQEDAFAKLKPDREEAEGPTGNEGAPIDRWGAWLWAVSLLLSSC